jgi:hypothetical protein
MAIGVFVLGMHRSGTSAATRLLNLLGIPTCDGEDLAVPTADNPTGYWESASLTAFDDRLLAALGCDWTCPPALEPAWHEDTRLDPLREDARALAARVLPEPPWVWKDPRNCVLFPFWAALLDVDPVVVLVHRNPLEIAASLEARDGLGVVQALALWERCLRLGLEAVSGLPVFVTGYAELLSAPLDWCGQARAFLRRTGVETSAAPQQAAIFVDASLRHARFTPEDVSADPALSDPQRALFLALEELRGAHDCLAPRTLPPETPATEAILSERRRAWATNWDLRRQYLELEDYARRLGERFVVRDEAARRLEREAGR